MLSISTDYLSSAGDVAPYLRAIAEAGFTYIHWCQEWCTDYLYSAEEINQIRGLLATYALQLNDLHATTGQHVHWASTEEEDRQGGLALVRNRIAMTAALGGDVIILHLPDAFRPGTDAAPAQAAVQRSLDDIAPFARTHGVRLAVENMPWLETDEIGRLLAVYPSDFLGLCYDAGHGNVTGDGLARLENCRHRLIAMHLHDNDGSADQHRLPFDGTVDWPRLAALIASSAYRKPITLEVVKGSHYSTTSATAFLVAAHQRAVRIAGMIERENESLQLCKREPGE